MQIDGVHTRKTGSVLTTGLSSAARYRKFFAKRSRVNPVARTPPAGRSYWLERSLLYWGLRYRAEFFGW